jgi:hypothetical protein
MSVARQNYTTAVEEGLNQQINMELKASHIYLSLHAYFSRDSIALPGLAHFFKESSDEVRSDILFAIGSSVDLGVAPSLKDSNLYAQHGCFCRNVAMPKK